MLLLIPISSDLHCDRIGSYLWSVLCEMSICKWKWCDLCRRFHLGRCFPLVFCFLCPAMETVLEDMAGSYFYLPLKGNMASGRLDYIFSGPWLQTRIRSNTEISTALGGGVRTWCPQFLLPAPDWFWQPVVAIWTTGSSLTMSRIIPPFLNVPYCQDS